jgi:serine/threonine-protein kinase RIO1
MQQEKTQGKKLIRFWVEAEIFAALERIGAAQIGSPTPHQIARDIVSIQVAELERNRKENENGAD